MSADDARYVVMPRPTLANDALRLRAVQRADIEPIRQWRNAQMEVLRQTAPVSPEEQERYFSSKVWPEMGRTDPVQILLAIESENELIGYGGLVHVSWPNQRAEVSFLVAPAVESVPDTRSAVFASFLGLVQELAFEDLGLRRLTTETFESRTRHMATLEAAGFVREGVLREHVLIRGVPANSIIHGLLAQDWRSRN